MAVGRIGRGGVGRPRRTNEPDYPDPPAPPDPPPDPPPSGNVLATHRFDTAGWVTFGQPLPEGVATGGVKVGSLPTQTDVKRTWDDGSIKFCIVTTKIVTPGTYDLTSDTASTGTFTPAAFPTASIALQVRMYVGPGTRDNNGTGWFEDTSGNTYTCAMPGSFSSAHSMWLDGPLVKEGRFIVAPDNNPPTSAALLRAIWDFRIYNDGAARVDLAMANTINSNDSGSVMYAFDVTVNGSVVMSRTCDVTDGPNPVTMSGTAGTSTAHGLQPGDYIMVPAVATTLHFGNSVRRIRAGSSLTTNGFGLETASSEQPAITNRAWKKIRGFIHFKAMRWRIPTRVAVGGYVDASLGMVPDFEPFYTSKACWRYIAKEKIEATSPFGYAAMTGWQWDIGGLGDLAVGEIQQGGRWELGLRPTPHVQYMLHKDPATRVRMLKHGDLTGSRIIHNTHADSRQITLTDFPRFWIGRGTLTGNGTNGPLGFAYGGYGTGDAGCAHAPSLSIMPYLITGDRYYLDQLKFRAAFNIMCLDLLGLLKQQQIRAIGIGLFGLVDCASWIPDDDTERAFFDDYLQRNLDDQEAQDVLQASVDPVLKGRYIGRGGGAGVNQLFMSVHACMGLHHAHRQGYLATAGTTGMRDALASYWFGMVNEFVSPQAGWMFQFHSKHIAGSGSGYLVNNASGYSAGATVIAVDSGTGVIGSALKTDGGSRSGDVVTFAGHATEYRIVSSVGLPVTSITISPALTNSVADNAAVTLKPTYHFTTYDELYDYNVTSLPARGVLPLVQEPPTEGYSPFMRIAALIGIEVGLAGAQAAFDYMDVLPGMETNLRTLNWSAPAWAFAEEI